MTSNLSLHKAVFSGNLEEVKKIVDKFDEKELNSQDIHGNTALHIAVMRGDKRCVELLVNCGAQTTVRNELNWMSLHEAISYGDTDIVKILNDSLTKSVLKYIKRDFIFNFVDQIKEDFVVKFEVRLKDYKPTTITSQPEIKMSLTKKGLKIRADLIITDCFHTRPQAFHLVFDLNKNNSDFIIITVGDLPFYQRVTFEFWEQTLTDIFSRQTTDEEIRELMSRESVSIKMDWSSKREDRPSFRKVVTKRVGGHRADILVYEGIDMITRTRTEHLRAREESNPTNGSLQSSQQRLPEPRVKNVSWEQYISAPKGQFPHLGREIVETVATNRVSVVIGLTEEIAIDWKWILESAQKILNNKLLNFVTQLSTDLPKGFPVVIDLPIKASVFLKWKLSSFEKKSDIEDSLFLIPESFQETVIFQIERNTP